ncbi:MAG: crossover junction endodeoxyribonuclease RuvC [Nitriliruptorales bacterium]
MSRAHTPRARLRVLGVDPGLTRCGVGVVDGPASRPRLAAVDVVRTDREEPTAVRLAALHAALCEAIRVHAPDAIACERVLFSANARTAMGVGQAAGVALLAAAQAGVPVASYSPNDVKLAVAGHGAADKGAVARMVAAQLHLADPPTPADAADALAVALCHLAHLRVDAGAATTTGASDRLAAARAEAEAAGRGGWEAVLQRSHVRVSDPGREAGR